MKSKMLISTGLAAIFAILAFDMYNAHDVQKSSGAPPGYCADPAGGNRTCSNCHAGPDVLFVPGLIVSDVPEEGYAPGETYTITAAVAGPGHNKFGFEVSPQDSAGFFMGTLVNVNEETQLTGSGDNYITHKEEGTTGDGARSWTFEWIAPQEGSGSVVFYGAFLVANASNNFNGDTTFTSNLVIQENTSVGKEKISPVSSRFFIYPNPANDFITISAGNIKDGSVFSINDQRGNLIMHGHLYNGTNYISVSHLEAGIYFITAGNYDRHTFKVVKQ